MFQTGLQTRPANTRTRHVSQGRNYHGSSYSNAAGPGRAGGPGPTNNKKYCGQKM